MNTNSYSVWQALQWGEELPPVETESIHSSFKRIDEAEHVCDDNSNIDHQEQMEQEIDNQSVVGELVENHPAKAKDVPSTRMLLDDKKKLKLEMEEDKKKHEERQRRKQAQKRIHHRRQQQRIKQSRQNRKPLDLSKRPPFCCYGNANVACKLHPMLEQCYLCTHNVSPMLLDEEDLHMSSQVFSTARIAHGVQMCDREEKGMHAHSHDHHDYHHHQKEPTSNHKDKNVHTEVMKKRKMIKSLLHQKPEGASHVHTGLPCDLDTKQHQIRNKAIQYEEIPPIEDNIIENKEEEELNKKENDLFVEDVESINDILSISSSQQQQHHHKSAHQNKRESLTWVQRRANEPSMFELLAWG
eukprot:TRINITY_DN11580_c0_g1_i1.p1 TRINITY_DN11580_c0_g1~~TRINITY_DN11580_c0_g1_i1.p1  ORF type:complete len:356 (+),score=125.61 TRINITY_DN11580_c0_g1_i1:111-1178(+)